MKIRKYKSGIIGSFLFAFTIVSCVQDDDFNIPIITCTEPNLSATKTPEDIYEYSSDMASLYPDDDIIEGYVVSSDEGGNFFKTLSIQSIAGTSGFSIALDVTNLYTQFEPGRKVYVKLLDRHTKINFGQLEIGDLFAGNQIGRIPETIYEEVLIRSCDFKSEETLFNTLKINQVSDRHLHTLVQFEGVQFDEASIEGTYYDETNDIGGATNLYLVDELGYKLIFRTSSFADFASSPVADGSGKIRGILTKFGDDYQLLARTLSDIKLDEARQDFKRLGIGALRSFPEDQIISDDRYIEGVVTLSGYVDGAINNENLTARNAVIQDETGGIVLRFDADAHELVEGDRVQIRISGYRINTFAGLTQLENLDFDGVNDSGENHIEIVGQEELPDPVLVTISQLLTNQYESQLIRIENVQFSENDLGSSYRGTRTVTDCDKEVPVITRPAATFNDEQITSGNGALEAVSSFFNGVQLQLRNLNSVEEMNHPRCAESRVLFEEEFNDGIPETWTTIVTKGSRSWIGADFSEVFYATISAFDGSGNPILDLQSWLISPVIDFEEQENEFMVIKLADAFQNGNPLKVYYSTDYTGSGDPGIASWTEVGAEVIAPLINNGGYFDNIYEESAPIDLSIISGQAYIAFVYDSDGGTISTTLQLDRVELRGR